MSVDATRLQDICTYGIMLVSGMFQITLAFVSLYNLLGWSSFVGVAIMVRCALTIPMIADRQVLDLLDTIECIHRQGSEEAPAETNGVERQEDEDYV